jgi:hypothetical protein
MFSGFRKCDFIFIHHSMVSGHRGQAVSFEHHEILGQLHFHFKSRSIGPIVRIEKFWSRKALEKDKTAHMVRF